MTKSILKEIMIILLLVLAVILLLGILLYDYVPLNKVIPEKVSYVVTDEIKAAIDEKKIADQEEVVLTYEVTSTDLNNYKRMNLYKAGRKNPFGSVPTQDNTPVDEQGGTTSSSGGTSSNTGSGASTNTNTGKDNNSGNTNYYPETGTK